MRFSERLRQMGACSNVVNWAEGKTQREAWDTCPYGSWMVGFIAIVFGVECRFYSRLYLIDSEWKWAGPDAHDIGNRAIKATRATNTGIKLADRVRAAISFEEVEKQYKNYLRRL